MEKLVLFKRFDVYATTSYSNYNSLIQDANKITKFPSMTKQEVIKTLTNWGIANEEDIIDCTGE